MAFREARTVSSEFLDRFGPKTQHVEWMIQYMMTLINGGRFAQIPLQHRKSNNSLRERVPEQLRPPWRSPP